MWWDRVAKCTSRKSPIMKGRWSDESKHTWKISITPVFMTYCRARYETRKGEQSLIILKTSLWIPIMIDWHGDTFNYEHKAYSTRKTCPCSAWLNGDKGGGSERTQKCRIGIKGGRCLRGIYCVCSVSTCEVNVDQYRLMRTVSGWCYRRDTGVCLMVRRRHSRCQLRQKSWTLRCSNETAKISPGRDGVGLEFLNVLWEESRWYENTVYSDAPGPATVRASETRIHSMHREKRVASYT